MKVNTESMRSKVLAAVKANKKCANDDKFLIASIWQNEGWNDPKLYQHLKDVSSPETIRRTRAKLVEEGLIKPSKKVQQARKKEEGIVRKSLSRWFKRGEK